MKTRILTALAIILVVFFPVWLGGIPLELLALFIICTGAYEWLNIVPGAKRWSWWAVPLAIGAIIFSRFTLGFPIAWYGLLFGIIWAVPVFDEKFSVPDAWNLISLIGLFSLTYLSVLKLVPMPQYLWTICFATYGSDTGAYFAGRFLGKHKMNPRISPKKSWEGFFGGWAAGAALSLLMSFCYAGLVSNPLNLILCLVCPVTAELGDLCFSAMKRQYGAKDFSDLLPGHGGVLDRVDSLLYNILIFGILSQIPGMML